MCPSNRAFVFIFGTFVCLHIKTVSNVIKWVTSTQEDKHDFVFHVESYVQLPCGKWMMGARIGEGDNL